MTLSNLLKRTKELNFKVKYFSSVTSPPLQPKSPFLLAQDKNSEQNQWNSIS